MVYEKHWLEEDGNETKQGCLLHQISVSKIKNILKK